MQGVGDGSHSCDEDHTGTNVFLWRDGAGLGPRELKPPCPPHLPFRADSSLAETRLQPPNPHKHQQTLRRPVKAGTPGDNECTQLTLRAPQSPAREPQQLAHTCTQHECRMTHFRHPRHSYTHTYSHYSHTSIHSPQAAIWRTGGSGQILGGPPGWEKQEAWCPSCVHPRERCSTPLPPSGPCLGSSTPIRTPCSGAGVPVDGTCHADF